MTASFANIGKVPELRNRLLFTVAMLAVYRLGIFISVPGVDRALMQKYLEAQSGTLFGMFNMFVGGLWNKRLFSRLVSCPTSLRALFSSFLRLRCRL